MKSWSITRRIFLTCLLFVAIFFPATIFSMQNAYERSLLLAKKEELNTTAFAMLSEFEFDEGRASMPPRLFVESLNLPGSDLVAAIRWRNQQVWQSQSAIDSKVDMPLFGKLYRDTLDMSSGQSEFLSNFNAEDPHFAFVNTAEFKIEGKFERVTFLVINTKDKYQNELNTFINRLWGWIGVLGVILLGLIALSLRSVFLPMKKIISRIGQIERGEINHITDDYPPELQPLQNGINKLLASEQEQRERYKKSLDDLAHSIKTPLSVILGQDNLTREVRQPVLQIDNIVKRQLKRATINVIGYLPSIDIFPLVQSIVEAMEKIHQDKKLTIHIDMEEPALLSIDQTDFMEIAGNLLDNACKAANKEVIIGYKRADELTHVSFKDDGSGISADEITSITQRGKRLDSYTQGQGLGLALVVDMLDTYGGELDVVSYKTHKDDLIKHPTRGSIFTIKLPHQR
ncbi:histidine kinase [Glaciecola sp. MH2013]|uniref:ATP-binding protein n=1 Tax=Glaciecola sp. MH2013 TaxID=2785524 RepID=UPI0018A08431|nr:ATP-binding protein [Glaciecola sp. MH2013]MBF7073141.1 histidine kinase [Glaciecola sp. MH2013]